MATSLIAMATVAWGDARAQETPSSDVELSITEQDFGVAPGGSWTATLAVTGDLADLADLVDAVPTTTTTVTTTTAPTTTTTTVSTATSTTSTAAPAEAGAMVEVRAHRRIDDTADLDRAENGVLGPVLDRVEVPGVDAVVGAGDGPTLRLDIATSTEAGDPRLTLRRPGLYPISIVLRVDDDTIAEAVTFVERLPIGTDADPPVGLALLATIADPGPDPTAAELAASDDELDQLSGLAAATDAPFTVALPPTVAARVDEELALALLDAELLALPALPLDPSSAIAIDRTDAFTRELLRGEDQLAAALATTPTQRTAWLATGPLSTAAAATLRDPLGFRLLVFDENTYRSLEGSIGDFTDSSLSFEVALGDGNTLPAMVLSPLGEALDPDRDDDTTAAEAAVELMSELVVVRRELGIEQRRNVVLAPPDLGVPDPATVAALAGDVAQVPGIELTTLARVAGGTDSIQLDDGPLTVELPDEAGPDLAERNDRIELTRVSVAAYGSMLADEGRLDDWQSELDTMLSTALDDDTVDRGLDRLRAQLEEIRTSVVAPDPFSFTLTGRRSTLRLTIRNTAAETRTVVVRASSPKLRFPEGDTRVVLQPGPNEVSLAVEARANGTSSVSIELLTPVFEQALTEPTFLTANVNALTGLGQVITGGALVVLGTWWFSHFRRRRRQRATPAPIVVSDDEPNVSPDAAEVAAHHDVAAEIGDADGPVASPDRD